MNSSLINIQLDSSGFTEASELGTPSNDIGIDILYPIMDHSIAMDYSSNTNLSEEGWLRCQHLDKGPDFLSIDGIKSSIEILKPRKRVIMIIDSNE